MYSKDCSANLQQVSVVLILKAGCTHNEAHTIIQVLRKKFKPFDDFETINNLVQDDSFVTRVGAYKKYGLEMVLSWINIQQIFSNLPMLQLDRKNKANDVKPPSPNEKAEVNLYGHLITFRTLAKDKLVHAAFELAKEVCADPQIDKGSKSVNYFFDKLAHRINIELKASHKDSDLLGLLNNLKEITYYDKYLKKAAKEIIADMKIELTTQVKVTHLGLAIKPNKNYVFSPKDSFSIWFSNNPNKAMPIEHKAILASRALANLPGVTRLVYSSKCLVPDVNKEFIIWAKENKINLIDLDALKPEKNSDIKLMKLAQFELEHMRTKTGGNPAAASDLVRWISVVSDKPCVYIDADMPLSTHLIKAEKVIAKHPVLLNMGSVLIKQGNKLPLENLVLNTDIISFTAPCVERQIVMDKVAETLIKNYENCQQIIENSTNIVLINLKSMPGYQRLLVPGTSLDLPKLRQEIAKAHSNIMDYARFVGPDYFATKYNLGHDKSLITEAIAQGNVKFVNHIISNWHNKQTALVKKGKSLEKETIISTLLKEQMALLYKPLVMEFSGPNAVNNIIVPELKAGGVNESTVCHNLKSQYKLSQPLRQLQEHACSVGKTNFTSNNIAAWCTPEEVSKIEQEQRQDGLSWMPDEQNKLSI